MSSRASKVIVAFWSTARSTTSVSDACASIRRLPRSMIWTGKPRGEITPGATRSPSSSSSRVTRPATGARISAPRIAVSVAVIEACALSIEACALSIAACPLSIAAFAFATAASALATAASAASIAASCCTSVVGSGAGTPGGAVGCSSSSASRCDFALARFDSAAVRLDSAAVRLVLAAVRLDSAAVRLVRAAASWSSSASVSSLAISWLRRTRSPTAASMASTVPAVAKVSSWTLLDATEPVISTVSSSVPRVTVAVFCGAAGVASGRVRATNATAAAPPMRTRTSRIRRMTAEG